MLHNFFLRPSLFSVAMIFLLKRRYCLFTFPSMFPCLYHHELIKKFSTWNEMIKFSSPSLIEPNTFNDPCRKICWKKFKTLAWYQTSSGVLQTLIDEHPSMNGPKRLFSRLINSILKNYRRQNFQKAGEVDPSGHGVKWMKINLVGKAICCFN